MKLFRITITFILVIALAAGSLSACSAPRSTLADEAVETEVVDTPAAEEAAEAPSQKNENEAETATIVEDETKADPAPAEKPEATEAPVATPAPTAQPAQTGSGSESSGNGGSTGSSTAPTPAPTQKPAETHTHSWTQQTKTVHHDAVTEQVKVVDQPATEGWYEEGVWHPNVICQGCGASFGSTSDWSAHSTSFFWQGDESHACYRTEPWYEEGAYHEGTPEVSHYETRVVKAAWDETVVTGYTCSCGATKAA